MVFTILFVLYVVKIVARVTFTLRHVRATSYSHVCVAAAVDTCSCFGFSVTKIVYRRMTPVLLRVYKHNGDVTP